MKVRLLSRRWLDAFFIGLERKTPREWLLFVCYCSMAWYAGQFLAMLVEGR